MKKQDRNSGYFDNLDNLDKLESLKQEYNEIPVPDAAKARILALLPLLLWSLLLSLPT